MDLDLKGRVVLVTGGSKGIGLACAEAFAGEGARVAISSRSRDNLAAAERTLGAKGHAVASVAADLVDAKAALALVAEVERRVGPVEVLINSAGAAKRHAPDELDMQAWHDAMDAKYFTYVHAIQAVLPGMAARRRGAIVNIVGQGGKIASPPGRYAPRLDGYGHSDARSSLSANGHPSRGATGCSRGAR